MKYIISFIVALMFTFNTNAQNAMDNAVIKNIFHFITESDYDAASKYLENPEEYDFNKILNW